MPNIPVTKNTIVDPGRILILRGSILGWSKRFFLLKTSGQAPALRQINALMLNNHHRAISVVHTEHWQLELTMVIKFNFFFLSHELQ